MPETTAVLSYAQGDPFVVADVRVDEPRGDEILVRIEAAGICHTDLVNRVAGTRIGPFCSATKGQGPSRRSARRCTA